MTFHLIEFQHNRERHRLLALLSLLSQACRQEMKWGVLFIKKSGPYPHKMKRN